MQGHLSQERGNASASFRGQQGPDRRRQIAHRGIQANAPGRIALQTRFSAIRPDPSIYERHREWDIEWAFRDSKTVQLEMRPVYLRNENRTRGHALVVMVAYLLTQALRQCWRDIDLTVQEGLDRLASFCVVEVIIGGRPSYNQVPTPRDDVRQLFEAAAVAIPAALPLAPARVATKQELPQRRNIK